MQLIVWLFEWMNQPLRIGENLECKWIWQNNIFFKFKHSKCWNFYVFSLVQSDIMHPNSNLTFCKLLWFAIIQCKKQNKGKI